MTSALLYAYVIGWILTSIAMTLAAWRLQDRYEPAPHPTLLSIVAGAFWPVLVIALAEAALMAITQESVHDQASMSDKEPLFTNVA